MRLTFSPNNNIRLLITFSCVSLFAIGAVEARAQKVTRRHSANRFAASVNPLKKTDEPAPETRPESADAKINSLEQMLLEQSQRLDRLQQTIAEQQETIRLLAAKVNNNETTTTAAAPAPVAPQTVKTPTIDERVKTVEFAVRIDFWTIEQPHQWGQSRGAR
jgi:uncharacterized coiled-coil protein SlyX